MPQQHQQTQTRISPASKKDWEWRFYSDRLHGLSQFGAICSDGSHRVAQKTRICEGQKTRSLEVECVLSSKSIRITHWGSMTDRKVRSPDTPRGDDVLVNWWHLRDQITVQLPLLHSKAWFPYFPEGTEVASSTRNNFFYRLPIQENWPPQKMLGTKIRYYTCTSN